MDKAMMIQYFAGLVVFSLLVILAAIRGGKVSISHPKWGGSTVDFSKSPTRDREANGYDRLRIRRSIRKRYGKRTGFLVIKYGSCAYDWVNANDVDYLVIVYAESQLKEPKKTDCKEKRARKAYPHLIKNFDLNERLYDSFLCNLILGRPYEISVAFDGKIHDSHLMDDKHWSWLVQLSHNIRIQKSSVLESLRRGMDQEMEELQEHSCDRVARAIIIILYHIACDMIKIKILETPMFDDWITGAHVYPLSKAENLKCAIENEEARNLFDLLITWFKHTRPPDCQEDVKVQMDRLLDLLGKDETYHKEVRISL